MIASIGIFFYLFLITDDENVIASRRGFCSAQLSNSTASLFSRQFLSLFLPYVVHYALLHHCLFLLFLKHIIFSCKLLTFPPFLFCDSDFVILRFSTSDLFFMVLLLFLPSSHCYSHSTLINVYLRKRFLPCSTLTLLDKRLMLWSNR
jgi:hypothetical protein